MFACIGEGERNKGDFRGKMMKFEKVRYWSQSSSRALKERSTLLRETASPAAIQGFRVIFTGLLRHMRFLAMTVSYDEEKNSL